MPNKLTNLRPPNRKSWGRHDDRFRFFPYRQAAPFFENPRGVLIHRPRSIYRIEANCKREPWYIVEYWCNNHGRLESDDSNLLFDPGEKLICSTCEANAIAKGEPTSSELAGRHVCIGVCRPVNVCPEHRD